MAEAWAAMVLATARSMVQPMRVPARGPFAMNGHRTMPPASGLPAPSSMRTRATSVSAAPPITQEITAAGPAAWAP
ncbi:hypothetical protein SDIAM26S_02192 [Streptomyces diastaticus subsp. diastaticus]